MSKKEKKLGHGDPVVHARTGATGRVLDAYTGGPDAPPIQRPPRRW